MRNAWLVKIFLGILAQMQGDVGAGAITFRRADTEPAAAITLPAAGAGAAMVLGAAMLLGAATLLLLLLLWPLS